MLLLLYGFLFSREEVHANYDDVKSDPMKGSLWKKLLVFML